MSNSRKNYNAEFKKQAVRMSYSSERTAVAESLGVTSNMLYRWRGDKTRLVEQQGELSELRKRNAELEEENYILKKSRPSPPSIKSENNGVLHFDRCRCQICQGEVG